jgi:GNAT superfamily N-acetyltransferase
LQNGENKALQYRKPALDDLDDIVELLLKFSEEFSDIYPQAERDRVSFTVDQHYKNGLIYSAYEDDKVVGSIGAISSEWWFSSKKFVAETWFYVLPEYRSYAIAKELLAKIKEYRRDETVLMPVITGLDRPALYERLKFKNMGTMWRYN